MGRSTTKLSVVVRDCGASGVKEDGKKAEGLMCVKETETGVRGKVRDISDIRVS